MKKQFLEISPPPDNEEISAKAKQLPPQTTIKYWLLFPLVGAVFFGCGNFSLAQVMLRTQQSRYQNAQWLGFTLAFIVFHSVSLTRNLLSKRPLLGDYKGVFYDESGKMKRVLVITFILRIFNQMLTFKMLSLVYLYATKAGQSPAIMNIFVSFASIISALGSYIVYREKLSKIQFASIILLLLAVISICYSKGQSANDAQVYEVSIYVPISLALALCFIVALNQILGKVTLTNGYKALYYTTDFMFLQSLGLVPFFIREQIIEPYNMAYVFQILLSALLLYLGQIFQNIGLKFGKVGINQAITQIQIIIQLFLEFIVIKRTPTGYEIFGVALSIVGIGLNAFRK